MARNVDLATLRDRVRWRTDTENATRRFTNTEVNDAINEGIAQFHAELVRARGQGFSEASTTVTTSVGVSEYPLPAEFLEVVKVFTVIDGQEYILRTYEEFDTNGLVEPAVIGQYTSMCYRLVGDNITFRPVPGNVVTISIKYISTAVKLLNDNSTVDGIDGLEEYIVCWAGSRIAMKQRDWELKGALDADASGVLDRLRALQPARNAAEPPRMQDVRQGALYWRRWDRRLPRP